ncbi:MAG: DUF2442 domain-containing protein [Caldilinea sp. CFX5]|nr:DUF2442 domain-containing protein [Caldilinea sp. CFX5]
MAKVKIGPWEIEEAELDRQHLEAQQRGREQLQTEPQAQSITYDQQKGHFVIELKSGVTVLLPAHLLQGLEHATPAALADVQLGPRGASLHWESLDVSFSLAGLLAGVFGTRAWMQEMGRRGGSATSTAKAAAARLNGKKGGRPAKAAQHAHVH